MFVYSDQCVSITQITSRTQKEIEKNRINVLNSSEMVSIKNGRWFLCCRMMWLVTRM